MSALRERTIREMQLRRFTPATQKSYLKAVVRLVKHYRIAPDLLSLQQVHEYLLFLADQRRLQWNALNVAVAALRFFYVHILKRRDVDLAIPIPKRPARLPDILSDCGIATAFHGHAGPQHAQQGWNPPC